MTTRRQMFPALAAFLVAPLTGGCGAVVAALPTIARIITSAMAILVGVNNGIQEVFRTKPDIPLRARRLYAAAFDKAMTALRLFAETTEGGRDLSDGDVQAAFDHFLAAYQEWRDLMQREAWMNQGGAVVIEGQVVAEAPPAKELRL